MRNSSRCMNILSLPKGVKVTYSNINKSKLSKNNSSKQSNNRSSTKNSKQKLTTCYMASTVLSQTYHLAVSSKQTKCNGEIFCIQRYYNFITPWAIVKSEVPFLLLQNSSLNFFPFALNRENYFCVNHPFRGSLPKLAVDILSSRNDSWVTLSLL